MPKGGVGNNSTILIQLIVLKNCFKLVCSSLIILLKKLDSSADVISMFMIFIEIFELIRYVRQNVNKIDQNIVLGDFLQDACPKWESGIIQLFLFN